MRTNSEELNAKINSAIRILKIAEDEATRKYNEPAELCYSGGKDSDVILKLASMAKINFRAIYKNTTIDPVGTKKHVFDNKVDIINPKKSFFKLIEEKGFPSYQRRFCCEVLKEYKILNVQILGIRKYESVKRMKIYKNFENCRILKNKQRVRQYFPILDWTDQNIKEFIINYDIKLHPLYYDKNGILNIKKRLGCVGCPLSSDRGKSDFLENPKILKAYLRAGEKYFKTHKTRYNNAYDAFINLLFFKNYEDFLLAKNGGIFPEFGFDSKRKIEEYFKVKL